MVVFGPGAFNSGGGAYFFLEENQDFRFGSPPSTSTRRAERPGTDGIDTGRDARAGTWNPGTGGAGRDREKGKERVRAGRGREPWNSS